MCEQASDLKVNVVQDELVQLEIKNNKMCAQLGVIHDFIKVGRLPVYGGGRTHVRFMLLCQLQPRRYAGNNAVN